MIETVVLLGLASWRIANLFSQEEGPFRIFVRIRRLIGIGHDADNIPDSWSNNYLAQMFSCLHCFSLNVALVLAVAFYFYPTLTTYASLSFAISAVAILYERTVA